MENPQDLLIQEEENYPQSSQILMAPRSGFICFLQVKWVAVIEIKYYKASLIRS